MNQWIAQFVLAAIGIVGILYSCVAQAEPRDISQRTAFRLILCFSTMTAPLVFHLFVLAVFG